VSTLATPPPPIPAIPARTYTADELATILRVSRWTIFYWAKNGTLPKGRKIGRTVRWLPDDIRPLLERRP
jgi:predicted DNA-binding transcriptional regulator AlpA